MIISQKKEAGTDQRKHRLVVWFGQENTTKTNDV